MFFSIASIGPEKTVNITMSGQQIRGPHTVRIRGALLAMADRASILAVSSILINRIFATAA